MFDILGQDLQARKQPFFPLHHTLLQSTLMLENLSSMFYQGVEATKKRGKAGIGEKTMLDVLIPVSLALNELKNENDIRLKNQEKRSRKSIIFFEISLNS